MKPSDDQRIITLTAGNIRNSHFYLSDIIHFFPSDTIGGGSKKFQALRQLEIDFGDKSTILTDIAGDKKIFRKRSWVKLFFKINDLREGSSIIIEKTGPYRYKIYPCK